MKKDRIPELHFYEWRLTAWAMSETRDRLDATGRGIYRELLDQCYAQGRFPDDKEWICRRCACTPEQLESVWPIIERHFPKISIDARKKNISAEVGESVDRYRWNIFSNCTRREYFKYVDKQRANRKSAASKFKEIRENDKLASTTVGTRNKSGSAANQPNGNGNGNTTATAIQTNGEKRNASAHDPPSQFILGSAVNDATQFRDDLDTAFQWLLSEYPGEVNPFHDAEVMASVVCTFEEIAALRQNLPAWKVSEKWQEPRYIPSLANFLSKRQFKTAPKTLPPPAQKPGKDFVSDVKEVFGSRIAKGEDPWT